MSIVTFFRDFQMVFKVIRQFQQRQTSVMLRLSVAREHANDGTYCPELHQFDLVFAVGREMGEREGSVFLTLDILHVGLMTDR